MLSDSVWLGAAIGGSMSQHSEDALRADIAASAFQTLIGAIYITMGLPSCRVLFAELMFHDGDGVCQSSNDWAQVQLFWAAQPVVPIREPVSFQLSPAQV